MNAAHHEHREVLAEACAQAGFSDAGAQVIRVGENAIFQLPGRIVARIARQGQFTVAAKEVQIARWLAHHDVPAVRGRYGPRPWNWPPAL